MTRTFHISLNFWAYNLQVQDCYNVRQPSVWISRGHHSPLHTRSLLLLYWYIHNHHTDVWSTLSLAKILTHQWEVTKPNWSRSVFFLHLVLFIDYFFFSLFFCNSCCLTLGPIIRICESYTNLQKSCFLFNLVLHMPSLYSFYKF